MALIVKGTIYNRMFKMISSVDHLSLKTGAAPVVKIGKAGGAISAAAGAVTELTNGWYYIALTMVDTNTAGDLAFYVTGTGADDNDWTDQVQDPTVAVFGVNLVQWLGTTPLALTTAGRVNAMASLRAGTCQAGSTTTTIVLDAAASSQNNLYLDQVVI